MRTILSIAILPAFLAVIAARLLGLFYYSCADLPLAGEYSIQGHVLAAGLYFSLAAGLPLAVFSTLAGVVLTVLSFILKSWIRAFMSMVIAVSAFYIWVYMVNAPLP